MTEISGTEISGFCHRVCVLGSQDEQEPGQCHLSKPLQTDKVLHALQSFCNVETVSGLLLGFYSRRQEAEGRREGLTIAVCNEIQDPVSVGAWQCQAHLSFLYLTRLQISIHTTWKVILKAPQCRAFKITYF